MRVVLQRLAALTAHALVRAAVAVVALPLPVSVGRELQQVLGERACELGAARLGR